MGTDVRLPPERVFLEELRDRRALHQRLDQLVWNLIENALRYTPRGGRVELELRRHGAEAVLRCSDTGVGIPAEHLPLQGTV